MQLQPGALASHFTLLGIDGREYSVPGSCAGQPLVLVFFKTTCATCDLAFPYFSRLLDAYPDGCQIWAVSQDAADRAVPYARERGVDCPVLIDSPEFQVSRLYDPPATPTVFLVDAEGRVDYATHGFAKADMNELSARIAGMLAVPPSIIAPAGDGKPDFKPG